MSDLTMPIKKQGPPTRISTSQINCYSSCPRKFQFSYIKHLPEVTKSISMSTGSEVHDLIARGIFVHHDDNIDAMLQLAKEYLDKIPKDTEVLTEYKLRGHVCGKECVGIYDKLFPNIAHATDWKSGADAAYKKAGHDIQAYIYTILYEEKYEKELLTLDFVFFGSQSIYSPDIQSEKFRTRIAKKIQDVLDIAYDPNCIDYPKKIGPLCSWCGYQPVCEMFP